jgi:hypothetical protein
MSFRRIGMAFGTSIFCSASYLVLQFIDLQLGNASSFLVKKLDELLERLKSFFRGLESKGGDLIHRLSLKVI